MQMLNVGFMLLVGLAGSVVQAKPSRSHYDLPQAYKQSKKQAEHVSAPLPKKIVSKPVVVAMNEAPPVAPTSVNSVSATKQNETEKPKKPIEIRMAMLLEGQSRRDEKSERQDVVYTAIVPKLKWNLTEWAWADVQPKFKFRTGHIQGASPTNGREGAVSLNKAEFVFSDADYFQVSVGAVETSEIHSTLLLDIALPGGLIKLSTGDKSPFSVTAFGTGGVPGSSTKTDISDEVDKTPSYTSAGLQAKLKTETILAVASVASFEYRNLPTSIGSDSVTLGNSVLGGKTTPVQTFQYQFRGVEASTRFDWKLSPRFEWKNHLAGVKNSEAPDELNTGILYKTSLDVNVTGDWMLSPAFMYFNVQPDAVVANFNDDLINTNRIGYLGGFFVQYKKMFRVGGLAGERTMVFESDTQGRETYVGLSLEALDVSF